MIEECASLSKIWRAEALLYNSCGLNNSAMKSRVNMARTTSCRTVHGRAPPRETLADCRGESRFEERHLLGEAYAPFTDLSPGIFWAFSRCRRAGSTQRWQRRPAGAKHHASVPQCGLGRHTERHWRAHLVEDINHFTTQVQDQERHPEHRHLEPPQARPVGAPSGWGARPSRSGRRQAIFSRLRLTLALARRRHHQWLQECARLLETSSASAFHCFHVSTFKSALLALGSVAQVTRTEFESSMSSTTRAVTGPRGAPAWALARCWAASGALRHWHAGVQAVPRGKKSNAPGGCGWLVPCRRHWHR